MESQVIEAEAIRLRPHRPDDVPAMVEQCRDPEMQRWTTVPAPYEHSHAEQFLDQAIAGWRDGQLLGFAIADPGTDEFLGTIDLRLDGNGAAAVGFGLHPAARGRGVMTTALRAVTDWAFTHPDLELQVLRWNAIVGNWASRRAAWHVGFRFEGTLRALVHQRGTRRDAWWASLLRDDPRPQTRWLRAARLVDERVVLRPLEGHDAAAYVEACADPDTRQWLSRIPVPCTLVDAATYIGSREEQHAADLGVYWCAADPATDRLLGAFGLTDIDHHSNSADLGYLMHPAARGRGIATAAVRQICRYALSSTNGLGLRRLGIQVAAGNVASARVAEKAGFTRTGVDRGAERLGDGSYDDLLRYDLLDTDLHPTTEHEAA